MIVLALIITLGACLLWCLSWSPGTSLPIECREAGAGGVHPDDNRHLSRWPKPTTTLVGDTRCAEHNYPLNQQSIPSRNLLSRAHRQNWNSPSSHKPKQPPWSVNSAPPGSTKLPSINDAASPQQVVLAASICTRGGKAVLSRQFREMPRSRIEALLASFPKLADSGTQHTTVEQDNVRFVYQPLDELYMVLITNRQSNILQDIDSLHLFAQVVTSTCKSLDEREILRNAYELLSAFDELVTLGYRENLTISQIKTFLEMESHEERIQEIIARVRQARRQYGARTPQLEG